MIIGIDPGPLKSGFVAYCFATKTLLDHDIADNLILLERIPVLARLSGGPHHVVIEKPENFGMVAGDSIFDTLIQIGDFRRGWIDRGVIGEQIHLIKRGDIKYTVLGKRGGTDSFVRASVISRYGETLKKTEKSYRLKGHEWQAFAAAEALWLKLKEGK